jgi:hypothetical protein
MSSNRSGSTSGDGMALRCVEECAEDRLTKGDAPAAGELGAAAEQIGDTDERYGPVAIVRYVKTDGRALLLYRCADEQRS